MHQYQFPIEEHKTTDISIHADINSIEKELKEVITTLETRLKFVSSELRRLKLGKIENNINHIEEFNAIDGEYPIEITIYHLSEQENTHIHIENINVDESFNYVEVVKNNVDIQEEEEEWIDEPETKVVKMHRKGGEIVQGCDIYIGPKCFSGGWRLEKTKWSPSFAMRELEKTQIGGINCIEII